MEIIPAIIAHTYEEFEKMVKQVEPFVDRVQLDIMDSVFVEDRTIDGIEELKKINTQLKFDVHLMIKDPQYLSEWFDTRADLVFVHIESGIDIESFINLADIKGKKAGIAINPESDVERLNGFANMTDIVQFMTVHPGHYGAHFVEGVLYKIASFHAKHPHVKIYVDGGMNPDTIKRAVQAGATQIVVGSYIFSHSGGPGAAIEELKKAI